MKKTLMLLMLAMVSVGAWAQKITSVSGIISGHKYYIGAATGGTDYYFKTDCSALRNSVPGTAVTSKSEATVIQFIQNGTGWNLKFDGTDYYLSLDKSYPFPSSEKGHVQVVSSPVSFDIKEDGLLLKITYGNCLQKANSSENFGAYNYATGQTNVWLEEVPSTATITLNSACTDGSKVYGTYSNASAWVVPEALTVSAITVSGETLTKDDYATGDIVPANTGVLVSASAGGDYTVYLSSEVGAPKTNALRPTGNGITAEAMATADAGKEYFRLTMHNGSECGFWWGAADGAAFALGANKAYLVADPASTSARGFSFSDNSEALESIEISRATTIYTLDGVKVNELRKGLNIVNGKKVMVMD